jgi:two-component system NtrC family sensor kinase
LHSLASIIMQPRQSPDPFSNSTETTEDDYSVFFEPPGDRSPSERSRSRPGLKGAISAFNLRQKISLGYIVTLGIVAIGLTGGFVFGTVHQENGIRAFAIADEREQILSDLRIASLEVPLYIQELAILPDFSPQKFDRFILQWKQELQEIDRDLTRLQTLHSDDHDLSQFFEKYQDVSRDYEREIEKLSNELTFLLFQTEEIGKVRSLLLNFRQKPVIFRFDRFSRELEVERKVASYQAENAQLKLNQSILIRKWFISITLLLSAIVAILFALYTSRAIALPIQGLTRVVRQATEESNFDLEVPVTTEDEIGQLALSFNQLIAKVKYLLGELEAEKQTQLIQSEKMASLGRMLAGVAHEINNPINFIYGNIDPAREYIEDMLTLIETYEAEIPNPPDAVRDCAEEIEIEFLKEDLLKLLQSMKIGADRARAIVLSLKNFSRLDEANPQPVNLHECIDSSLLILHNRVKREIEIDLKYGEIPKVEGYMGLLYQVFMNILSNAVDALEEQTVIQGAEPKKITISTELLNPNSILVRIADNGCGIKPQDYQKIFENFFTTKPRGIGTGLGLAISRQIVEEKHGGKIECLSTWGRGTEFRIELPIKNPDRR